ncbi:MAG: asparagine synthase C-terminal domain-containing protein [Candidatus Daviesbacteria bacterium]|nr:asparagine synthase C-terminal domain-containing protein [Candidatus Daviesbacteria bacterium]
MNKLEERIKKEVAPLVGKPLALSGGIDSSLLAALLHPKFAISVELPGGSKYNEIKWAKIVTKHLGLKHIIVHPDDSKFDEYMKLAVKAIGRPIPHFNIFPLYCMYKKLAEMGIKEIVLGDGPDETMYGYARDIIINYLYQVYEFESFENYKELIDKILPSMTEAIKATTGLSGFTDIVSADIEKRKEMDDMSDGIARSFGIKNIRPYQDNPELDDYMRDLPIKEKIKGRYGKYALRKIAEKYLPKKVAWRKKKLGGPVYPVNLLRGWMDEGEFDKKHWLEYQEKLLG